MTLNYEEVPEYNPERIQRRVRRMRIVAQVGYTISLAIPVGMLLMAGEHAAALTLLPVVIVCPPLFTYLAFGPRTRR